MVKRAGLPCPRCGGQLLRLYRGEEIRCFLCAYEPRTERELVTIAGLVKIDGVRTSEPRRGSLSL